MTQGSKGKILLLTGPTASGKTAVAIHLALKLNAIVLNADSRQIYKEIPIGTASPNQTELNEVEHKFVGKLSVTDSFTTADFLIEALDILLHRYHAGENTVVAGGTGLYFYTLVEGLSHLPEVDAELRNQINTNFEKYGLASIQKQLLEADPAALNRIDMMNPARVKRALEIVLSQQKSLQEMYMSESLAGLKLNNIPYTGFCLQWPRQILYDNINARVISMVKNGLEKEARMLLQLNPKLAATTVGFKEWIPYFNETVSIQDVIEKIQQHTRNYAKRQVTFFKNKLHFKDVDVANIVDKKSISNIESASIESIANSIFAQI